jgi:hypothetical protein
VRGVTACQVAVTAWREHYRAAVHVWRGLVEAASVVVGCLGGGLAFAGLWVLLGGGSFVGVLGWALAGLALALLLTGGSLLSRAATNDTRAFFGLGPEREDPVGGQSLTPLGLALLAGVPLLVAGLALVDVG